MGKGEYHMTEKTNRSSKLEQQLEYLGISKELFDAIIMNAPSKRILPGYPSPSNTFVTVNL